MRLSTLERLPAPGTLLPNEVIVQVGCTGCAGAGCGTFSVGALTRDTRKVLFEDLKAAQDLSEIPVTIVHGGTIRQYGQEMPECDPGSCQGDQSRLIIDTLREG